jgi:hypothetical protein
MKTVVALYNNVEDASRVVSLLTNEGIRANDINMVAGDPDNQYAGQIRVDGPSPEAEAAGTGVAAGGVIGGLLGVLVGVGAFAIPGLGPVIAAGPLVSGLIGAALGAAGGGLVGALVEWGVGEEEAEFYLEGVRRGGTLVVVRAPDEQAGSVAALMNQPGLVDIEQAAGDWRNDGWTGYGGDYDDVEFDTADREFRQHFDTTYAADEEFPYSRYVPAYRFGYFAAADDRFRGMDWAEAEPGVAAAWKAEFGRGDEDWERYRDALRFSYHKAQAYML